MSPRTFEAYQQMLNNIVRDSPPEKLVEPTSVTAQDFQEWVMGLEARRAAATVDQRISKGKAFHNWCVREGLRESDPMGAIKRPKKNWQLTHCPRMKELVSEMLRQHGR